MYSYHKLPYDDSFISPAGGISIICQNLVNCNCRIISTNPSLISTIMQNLNGRSRLEKKSSDFESPDGLQNFAPLGSVSIRM